MRIPWSVTTTATATILAKLERHVDFDDVPQDMLAEIAYEVVVRAECKHYGRGFVHQLARAVGRTRLQGVEVQRAAAVSQLMPRISEDEAREFLELLGLVDEDTREAMQEAYSDEMSSEEFEKKWGDSPGTIYVQAVRGKYEAFVKNVYLRD